MTRVNNNPRGRPLTYPEGYQKNQRQRLEQKRIQQRLHLLRHRVTGCPRKCITLSGGRGGIGTYGGYGGRGKAYSKYVYCRRCECFFPRNPNIIFCQCCGRKLRWRPKKVTN